jgi:hypothetical protein
MNKNDEEEISLKENEHHYVDTCHPLSCALSIMFPFVWIGGCFSLNENVELL